MLEFLSANIISNHSLSPLVPGILLKGHTFLNFSMPDLLVNTSSSKDENFESLEGNLN